MRESNKIFIIKIALVAIFLILPNQQSKAWGPITHMAINNDAYKNVYGNIIDENYKIFVTAGQNTDMISYFSTTRGYGAALIDTGRFNYAHDLFSFNNGLAKILDYQKDNNSNGDPTFGKLLVKISSDPSKNYGNKHKFYSTGWAGHQLGDRQAHGTDGYIVKVGDQALHLIRESEIDVYLYNKNRSLPEFLNQLKVVLPTKLIHETSVKSYNLLKDTNDKIIDRNNGLLTCERLEIIANNWSKWIAAYGGIVRVLASYDHILNFQPPSIFQDYYNASVNDVAAFLQNPDTTIPENTLTLKDRFQNFANNFLEYFNLKPQPTLAQTTDQDLLSREAYYQFFFDLANQAEQNGALQTTETIIDRGLPTERIEYSSEIMDDTGFDQALQTTINNYKNGTDESGGVMGRYMDNLINTEMSFDEALQNAIKPEDTTPPAIAINSPAERKYLHSENLTIDFSVSDEESGVASASAFLNEELVNQGQIIDLSLKPLGQYVFKVSAQDNEGNASEATVNFQIIATIGSLITNVNHYTDLGLISGRGIRISLLVKLYGADLALKFNKVKIAKGLLNSFIYEVQTLKNKKITPLAADLLIADAREVLGKIK